MKKENSRRFGSKEVMAPLVNECDRFHVLLSV